MKKIIVTAIISVALLSLLSLIIADNNVNSKKLKMVTVEELAKLPSSTQVKEINRAYYIIKNN